MRKFLRVSTAVLVFLVSTGSILGSPASDSKPATTQLRVICDGSDAPLFSRLLVRLAKRFGLIQPQESSPIPPRP